MAGWAVWQWEWISFIWTWYLAATFVVHRPTQPGLLNLRHGLPISRLDTPGVLGQNSDRNVHVLLHAIQVPCYIYHRPTFPPHQQRNWNAERLVDMYSVILSTMKWWMTPPWDITGALCWGVLSYILAPIYFVTWSQESRLAIMRLLAFW